MESISVECALGSRVVSDHALQCLHAYLSLTAAIQEGNWQNVVGNPPPPGGTTKGFLGRCSNKHRVAISGQLVRYVIFGKASLKAGDKACSSTECLLNDRSVWIPVHNDKLSHALIVETVSTYWLEGECRRNWLARWCNQLRWCHPVAVAASFPDVCKSRCDPWPEDTGFYTSNYRWSALTSCAKSSETVRSGARIVVWWCGPCRLSPHL